jgi:programmed cell death protein 5
MNNLQPVSNINPDELPEGFSTMDPNSKQSSASNAPQQQQQQQQQEEQKHAILQQALTPEALERLGRIKLVKQQKAVQVENAIVSMAMSGKLPGRINEGKLIEMLERGNAKAAATGPASISIQRKKYALDSDDDNDDDML